MILFQSSDIDHRIVKALRKFFINSTSIYSAKKWGTSIGKATIGRTQASLR